MRLVVTAPLHVAWYGTFNTTKNVSKKFGTANVKTEVVNDSGTAKSATVKTLVLDADGKTVAEMESTQSLAAGATYVFNQDSPPMADPKLWSPEHPNLYSVKTIVLDGGQPVDDYTSPLGFRWFEFTADRGFCLNGSHLYFHGADVHQDHAGWGDGVADCGVFRDVQMVKEAGFDFIRGSHYPKAPAFADACDQLGSLSLVGELFLGLGRRTGEGYVEHGGRVSEQRRRRAPFENSVSQHAGRHDPHPCAIIPASSPGACATSHFSRHPARHAEGAPVCLRRIVAYCARAGPDAPGGHRRLSARDIDSIGDVAGYNGDGATAISIPKPGHSQCGHRIRFRRLRNRPGKL